MARFRFQDLDIWKDSIEISDHFFDLADHLEEQKKFRFAEQLRGSTLSISNNISEGSGSYSNSEFRQFLNYSRRSCFETANILIILHRRGYVSEDLIEQRLAHLEILNRKISNF